MSEGVDPLQRATSSSVNKIDLLSKEDVVKFAKKQVTHIGELKSRNATLENNLKNARAEVSTANEEIELLRTVNEKLTQDLAARSTDPDFEQNKGETEEKLARESTANAEVLGLEIKDLESKVDHLNRALREKIEAVVRAQEVIAESDNTIIELRRSKTKAETEREEFEKRCARFTEELNEERKLTKDLTSRLETAENKRVVSQEKRDTETIALARRLAESEQRTRTLEDVVEALREDNLKLTADYHDSKARIAHIESDYNSYKSKVTFILEQNENQQKEKNEAEKTNVEELRKLQEDLNQAQAEILKMKSKEESATEELLNVKSRFEQLTQKIQDLQQDNLQMRTAHMDDIIRIQQSSADAVQKADRERCDALSKLEDVNNQLKLLASAKQKLELHSTSEVEREKASAASVAKKLEEALSRVSLLEEEILAAKQTTKGHVQQKLVVAVSPLEQIGKIGALKSTMAGPVTSSVSVASEPTQGDVSLEKVLFGDDDDDFNTNSDIGRDDSVEWQREKMQEEIENLKHSSAHMRELLNDLETSNRCLLEQNDFLKNEIRRAEREEERKNELSDSRNMEYLKNVFVNFLTPRERLDGEHEQLIVVLERILHLSPVEANVVRTAAGVLSHDERSPTTSANATWGSYFTGWTSN